MPEIVIVEDDPDICALLVTLLKHTGYVTTATTHGIEARQLIEERQPAIVILDLNLPVVDGWTILHELRSNPTSATIPVLVVTAAATPEALERVRAYGNLRIITKPFDVDDLLEGISMLLERQRALGES